MGTHNEITNPRLRAMFAHELQLFRKNARLDTRCSEWDYGMRFGLDAAYRRMQWQLDNGYFISSAKGEKK